MVPEIFISNLAVSLVLLPFLAWKWRISMKIAVPGAIIIGGVAGALLTLVNSFLPSDLNMAMIVLIGLALILLMTFLAVLVRFYRDPERHPLETKNVILAPADGRVVYTTRVEKGSTLVSTKGKRKFKLEEITATNLLADAAYLIGIDMNLLNVHVNRAPIAGKAVLQKHIKGRFMSLVKEESDIMNERVSTIIDNGTFSVGVVQIASRLVRKIVSYIKKDDNVEIGQRIGAILFGSQVDVVIPELENLKIEAKRGDEIKAGVSVIARYG